MLFLFRCRVHNWLLFVMEPPIALPAARVRALPRVFVCTHCVCVWRSGYFAPRQMCQCSVWSPARLFHVIVPAALWPLPSSLLISPSRQPLPQPVFPTLSLWSVRCIPFSPLPSWVTVEDTRREENASHVFASHASLWLMVYNCANMHNATILHERQIDKSKQRNSFAFWYITWISWLNLWSACTAHSNILAGCTPSGGCYLWDV